MRNSEPVSHRNSDKHAPSKPFRGFGKVGIPEGIATLEDGQNSMAGGIQMFDNKMDRGRQFMNQSMSEQSSREVAELLQDSRR